MSAPFRVGITRDFLTPDGRLGWGDIALDLLESDPAVTNEFLAVDAAELPPEGRPEVRTLGEVPLVVVRSGDDAYVLANRCSHLFGPLSQGKLDGDCVVCPWHGSTFRLSDGANVRGPAIAPQPAFATRVRGGVLEVCLPGAG